MKEGARYLSRANLTHPGEPIQMCVNTGSYRGCPRPKQNSGKAQVDAFTNLTQRSPTLLLHACIIYINLAQLGEPIQI